jgi:hypothetical protein
MKHLFEKEPANFGVKVLLCNIIVQLPSRNQFKSDISDFLLSAIIFLIDGFLLVGNQTNHIRVAQPFKDLKFGSQTFDCLRVIDDFFHIYDL